MLCVLLETSGPDGSIALCDLSSDKSSAELIGTEKWNGPSHSTFVTEAFSQLFKKTSYSPQELNLIALGIGPGRFTGIRVGVSFAKTLAFVNNVPVYPCSSLRILAESQINQGKPVLVLMNAFKNSLYVASYQKRDETVFELVAPTVMLPEQLSQFENKEYICVGDGYLAYESELPTNLKKNCDVKENVFPQANDLMGVLQKEFHKSRQIHWKNLHPVYLRSPVPILKS